MDKLFIIILLIMAVITAVAHYDHKRDVNNYIGYGGSFSGAGAGGSW